MRRPASAASIAIPHWLAAQWNPASWADWFGGLPVAHKQVVRIVSQLSVVVESKLAE
jgi:hypothetical protein